MTEYVLALEDEEVPEFSVRIMEDDEVGDVVAMVTGHRAKSNGDRIVACLNAMAGIPDPVSFIAAVRLEALRIEVEVDDLPPDATSTIANETQHAWPYIFDHLGYSDLDEAETRAAFLEALEAFPAPAEDAR